jgi:hypothetical protein
MKVPSKRFKITYLKSYCELRTKAGILLSTWVIKVILAFFKSFLEIF